MPSDDSADPGQPAHAGTARPPLAAPVVLELVIVSTRPVSGTVGISGRGSLQEFHGWIDLMSVIGSACTMPGDSA